MASVVPRQLGVVLSPTRIAGPRERLLDRLIENHAIVVNQISEKIEEELTQVTSDVLDRLVARAEQLKEGTVRKARLDAAINQSRAVLSKNLDERFQKTLASSRLEAAEMRAEGIRGTFIDMADDFTESVRFGKLSSPQIEAALRTPTFGLDTKDWTSYIQSKHTLEVDRTLRAAWMTGQNIQETVRQLRQITGRAKHEMESVARTSMITASNQAATETYNRNSDILSMEQWVATLDNRTCPECGVIDGRKWPIGTPHRQPPAHFRCRCMLAPVIKPGLLPGKTPEPPTWKQWIQGEFGGLNQRQIEARQTKVLGPTIAGWLQDGSIDADQLVKRDGSPRGVGELRAFINRSRATD